jgi:AmmeMemoRadiSam system protein B
MTTKASIIRRPVVAGQFYPGDADELRSTVDEYLAQASKSGPDPAALISPHAGYMFSGHVAAQAFKQAQGVDYDVIVVLGTNHRDLFAGGFSIWPEGAYVTPLGDAPIDSELAHALMEANHRIVFRRETHLYEHSIEVQVPFLQRVQPGKKFVPILVCDTSLPSCQTLANTLRQVLGDRKALLVASSDLSHFWEYDVASRIDRATLNAIVSLDVSALDKAVSQQAASLGAQDWHSIAPCGIGPIRAVITYAQAVGAQADLIKYANSGDVAAGDKYQVVGYGAVRFARGLAPKGE